MVHKSHPEARIHQDLSRGEADPELVRRTRVHSRTTTRAGTNTNPATQVLGDVADDVESADGIGPMTAVDLAHDDVGDGPAVVLIHGHPFNRSMWEPQLAALRDSFRVIAPDLRGYGDSPVAAGTVTMARLAADVRHLLDVKGIATAALVGLSMGGLVVMELAAAQPDRWWAHGFIATTAQRVTEEEQQARRASARTMEEQGMRRWPSRWRPACSARTPARS